MKLHILDNGYGAHIPFKDLFESVRGIYEWDGGIKRGDVIMFDGGNDISPSLYGQGASLYCGGSDRARDKQETAVFLKGAEVGVKFLGVCRGSQLLCALSGGTVIQHVVGHGGNHLVETHDGRFVEVSSTHHQMMNPFATEHELLARATHEGRAGYGGMVYSGGLSRCHLGQDGEEVIMPCEPEAVWFPKTQALALQWHPEFMPMDSECVQYSRELVKKYLLGE